MQEQKLIPGLPCFITENTFYLFQGLCTLDGKISGIGPDICTVLKKRVKVHDRTYQITKWYMHMYHVDPLRVLSGKDDSANLIYYT